MYVYFLSLRAQTPVHPTTIYWAPEARNLNICSPPIAQLFSKMQWGTFTLPAQSDIKAILLHSHSKPPVFYMLTRTDSTEASIFGSELSFSHITCG